MDWHEIRKIAIGLEETHPEADNVNLRFTDLREWILALPGFTGAPNGCNENILEAIQMAWLDERD
jgi:FeS assembly protein IscX